MGVTPGRASMACAFPPSSPSPARGEGDRGYRFREYLTGVLAACRRELFDCRLRRIYTGHMSRKFKTADYEATLNSTVTLRECLPPDHLARFIVDVIMQLDLSAL